MIKKAKFLAKEVALRLKYMTSKECIFCKIASGEMSTNKILETAKVVVINDVNPVAATHILIIPKNHIESVLTVKREDADDVMAMFEAAQKLVKDMKLDAYRLAFNGGRYQHVPHLHMHLLAGGKVEWSKL